MVWIARGFKPKFEFDNAPNPSRRRLPPNPKLQADHALNEAIRKGIIKREPCFMCGAEKSQGHHSSYSPEMWLVVTWLCSLHHNEIHWDVRRAITNTNWVPVAHGTYELT